MSYKSEKKAFEQQYYGGYCNKAREYGLNPVPYHKFQNKLNELLKENLTKKERMSELILFTRCAL